MALPHKDRKSEYESWGEGVPLGSMEAIEIAKLRQLEEVKWLLDDLVDELREIRRRQPPLRLG